VIRWLLGADARRFARSRLRASSLPADPHAVDDVVAEAGARVAVQMNRRAGVSADHVRRYGCKVVRSVVSSTLRSEDVELPADDQAAADWARREAVESEFRRDRMPDPDAPAVGDPVRVVAHEESVGRSAWELAAVLALLVFWIHPDAVPPSFPRPRAGARPDQARWWPALAAAGRIDLFEEHQPQVDGATIRKRRQRAVNQAEALLDVIKARVRRDGSDI
jgi:hypothetical protein